MSIHAIDKNMSVDNVIIEYRDRPTGSESKLNTFSDGFKVIRTIIRLFKNYKPFKFFSALAILLAIIATAFFIPVLITYFQSGLVPNFPTLIVCGFVYIAALLSFFNGLLLETLCQKNKQDFEMRLIDVENQYKDLLNK